jgi:hypothetical protein
MSAIVRAARLALDFEGMRLLDPGILPDKPSPSTGDKLVLRISGLPPYKEMRASIRNPLHRHHDRFLKLRKAAIRAMRGRRWTDNAVGMRVTVYAPSQEVQSGRVANYLGGVFDTLDGSHGFCFTYLPIVYQDDCQVCKAKYVFRVSQKTHYVVRIDFLS